MAAEAAGIIRLRERPPVARILLHRPWGLEPDGLERRPRCHDIPPVRHPPGDAAGGGMYSGDDADTEVLFRGADIAADAHPIADGEFAGFGFGQPLIESEAIGRIGFS